MSVLYHTDSRLRTAMHRINGVMQKRTFTGKNVKEIISQMINYIDKLGDLGYSRHEQADTLMKAFKIMVNRKVITVTNEGHGVITVNKGFKAPQPNRRKKTQRRAGHRQPVAASA